MGLNVWTSAIAGPLKRAAGIMRVGDAPEGASGDERGHDVPEKASSVPSPRRGAEEMAAARWGFADLLGGDGRARPEYGRYYASSVSVYAAIKLRADAVSRPSLRIYRQGVGKPEVDPEHPVARLMARVNPWTTSNDLWRSTEIHLNLWGSAFWTLERDAVGEWQIWPLRPDRVTPLPDERRYLRGFVYQGRSGPVAYTPDEVVWLRYYNPLEEYAGFSPLTPSRLSVDTGCDGMRFNRNFFRNSAQPDFVMLTDENMTDSEIADFYSRWEARYQGSGNAHRPAITNFIKDIKSLGVSHKDMDFIQGLRWSLEEVSRAFGVPKPLLADLERATFANINAAERMFWRNTIVPELKFLEEQLTRMLLPRLGYPGLGLEFDLSSIEALQEDENQRVSREMQLLDRGVVTINELRQERGMASVPWGDGARVRGVAVWRPPVVQGHDTAAGMTGNFGGPSPSQWLCCTMPGGRSPCRFVPQASTPLSTPSGRQRTRPICLAQWCRGSRPLP